MHPFIPLGRLKQTKECTMKNPFYFLPLLILVSACTGSIIYLLRRLRKDRELISLVGLFCLTMGVFLLVLDLPSSLLPKGHNISLIIFCSTGWLRTPASPEGGYSPLIYLSVQASLSVFICLPGTWLQSLMKERQKIFKTAARVARMNTIRFFNFAYA